MTRKINFFLKLFITQNSLFIMQLFFIGVIHFMEKENNRPTIEKNKETDKK